MLLDRAPATLRQRIMVDGRMVLCRDQVGRRVAAIDAGEVEMVPWEEAEAMIFGDVDASDRRS